MTVAAPAPLALELLVRGVVQGVGFRPHIHRLAIRYGLAGRVRNESGGVRITIEGEAGAVQGFLAALDRESPPLARIEGITAVECGPTGLTTFTIDPSASLPDARLPVPPDVALCAQCERELFDPENRRSQHAFITCTDCGPRYTVIEALPYDRERTSMRAFPMCPVCSSEYADPASRRFHSETNSCPTCGPTLSLVRSGGVEGDRDARHPVTDAARLLVAGLIVAVRGLGGFHLAVDASNAAAVRRLRARKARDAKPLAVMVRTIEEARQLADIGPEEAALLVSPERPVVLLHRRAHAALAPDIAPGLDTVGVMLAYTPLHHLLLADACRPLVMTSGNASDEPIAIGNDEALARLRDIADVFLLHDREIVARYDDSVARVVDGHPIFLRRARGYAPLPIALPVTTPTPLLAVGPHLKNTFTLARAGTAWVSQHVGDLDTVATLDHFERTLDQYRRLFRVEPTVVVRDAHPGYLSTRIADEMGLPTIVVQHHHAHLAAVAAEHGVTNRVVALTFDGTGYGEDGTIWGGEVLVGDLATCRRFGHLRPAPLPGGDRAARRPWRSALGYLHLAPEHAAAFSRAFAGVDGAERDLAEQQLAAGLNSPLHSSMGRLFDAAAAVIGVRRVSQFEGHAAMQLEALAGQTVALPLPFPLITTGTDLALDPLPLLAALGERTRAGTDPQALAAAFHESVAHAAARLALRACDQERLDTVALGGGVFQNARLLASTSQLLRNAGMRVLWPRQLGPGDGAISYGQAAIAAARLTQGA